MLSYGEFAFFEFKCTRLRYAQTAAVENKPCGCGSVHYITIGDHRLRTVAEATGLWDAESIIFNRGRSVASWTFTGRVFHHAQRPVERAPAYNHSMVNTLCGILYFAWHRHQIEGTNGLWSLIRETQAMWGKRTWRSFKTVV